MEAQLRLPAHAMARARQSRAPAFPLPPSPTISDGPPTSSPPAEAQSRRLGISRPPTPQRRHRSAAASPTAHSVNSRSGLLRTITRPKRADSDHRKSHRLFGRQSARLHIGGMRAHALDKSGDEPKVACIGAGEEAARSPCGQERSGMPEKAVQRGSVRGHGEFPIWTACRFPPSPRAAEGQRGPVRGRSEAVSYLSGRARRPPSQRDTGTATALPTSDHRKLLRPTPSAATVQSSGKPCSRSASRRSGFTTMPEGRSIAAATGCRRSIRSSASAPRPAPSRDLASLRSSRSRGRGCRG